MTWSMNKLRLYLTGQQVIFRNVLQPVVVLKSRLSMSPVDHFRRCSPQHSFGIPGLESEAGTNSTKHFCCGGPSGRI